jgi:hypothetical protein
VEILGLVSGVVGVVLAVYSIISQRKPNQQLEAIYQALINSPDLRVQQDANGVITSIRTVTGSVATSLPGLRPSGSGTVQNP